MGNTFKIESEKLIMKVYSSKSASNTLSFPKIYEIDVLYDVPFDVSVFAAESEINPVYLPDGTIDEQALADYNDFVDNLYTCLCSCFDVADIEEGTRSKTSWYFYLYGKNKEGKVATKFLVRLRVSDHEYSERHVKHSENHYVDYQAQDLKRPQTKKVQKRKLYSVIVNHETYGSYDDALDDMYDKMELLSDQLNNKGD